MSRVRLATAGIALVALLAFPRAASAGIIDFIWEMSGPQMVGIGFGCRWTDEGWMPKQCGLGSASAPPEPLNAKAETKNTQASTKNAQSGSKKPWLTPPFYVAVAGAYHFSTGKDSGDVEYRFFRNHMVSLEPTLEVHTHTFGKEVRMYQGLGGTLNYLFSVDHKPFFKPGIKLTPIALEYKRWSVGTAVRLYPDGFTVDQFNKGPRLHGKDRPSEYTIGFGVSYIIFKGRGNP